MTAKTKDAKPTVVSVFNAYEQFFVTAHDWVRATNLPPDQVERVKAALAQGHDAIRLLRVEREK